MSTADDIISRLNRDPDYENLWGHIVREYHLYYEMLGEDTSDYFKSKMNGAIRMALRTYGWTKQEALDFEARESKEKFNGEYRAVSLDPEYGRRYMCSCRRCVSGNK